MAGGMSTSTIPEAIELKRKKFLAAKNNLHPLKNKISPLGYVEVFSIEELKLLLL